jgi:hypothetical protein
MGISVQHKLAKRKGGTITGGFFNSLVAEVGRLPHFHKENYLIPG